MVKTAEQIAYEEAEALQNSGETAKAAIAFGKLAGYADARERSFALWESILERDTFIAHYSGFAAGIRNDGTIATTGQWSWMRETEEWTDNVAIWTRGSCIVALRSDGTVVATGENWDGLDKWHDIVAVEVSEKHIVGLRCDGTVVATGSNEDGCCDVSDWTDIVDLRTFSFGRTHNATYGTLGLRSDGTIATTLEHARIASDATDVKALCGDNSVIGLRKDGTVSVLVDANLDRNPMGMFDLQNWTDIADVSFYYQQTIGLRNDGTVVLQGHIPYGQSDASNWTDIVDIVAGSRYVVGLRRDGTVVAAGTNEQGQCDVGEWTDIVAIFSSGNYTVGLRRDGSVVATGDMWGDNISINDWTNIRLPKS